MPARRGARDEPDEPETEGYETDEYAQGEYAADETGDSDRDWEDDAGPDDEAADADGADHHDDDRAGDGGSGDGAPGKRAGVVMSAGEAGACGVRHVVHLAGRQATGVTALERTAEGWAVEVEVVENQRIPSSSDVLALYQVEIDVEGSLVGYRRTRRYPRGRGDGREDGAR